MAKLFPDRDKANGAKIKKEHQGSPSSPNYSAEKWQKDLNKKCWQINLCNVLCKFWKLTDVIKALQYFVQHWGIGRFFLDFWGLWLFGSSKIQAVNNRSLVTHQLLNRYAHNHTITDLAYTTTSYRKHKGEISNQIFCNSALKCAFPCIVILWFMQH